jgi:hypothetical protein
MQLSTNQDAHVSDVFDPTHVLLKGAVGNRQLPVWDVQFPASSDQIPCSDRREFCCKPLISGG